MIRLAVIAFLSLAWVISSSAASQNDHAKPYKTYVVTVEVTTLAGKHPNSPFIWTKKIFPTEEECAADLADNVDLRADLQSLKKNLTDEFGSEVLMELNCTAIMREDPV